MESGKTSEDPGGGVTVPSAPSPVPCDSSSARDLLQWQRLPVRPIPSIHAIPAGASRPNKDLVTLFLTVRQQAVREFRTIAQGGSTAATVRRILPVLLFRKFEILYDVPDHSHVYLLAFCQTRQAPRTFRLDRIIHASGRL